MMECGAMSEIETARAAQVLRQFLYNKYQTWILDQCKTNSNYINVIPIVNQLDKIEENVSKYTLRRIVTKVIINNGGERINPRGVYRIKNLKRN